MTEPQRLHGDGCLWWLTIAMYAHKIIVEPAVARWRGWRFR